MHTRMMGALAVCWVLLDVSAGAQEPRTVRADAPPVWGEGVRLVEEVRIGSLDGEPEYALGMVGSVAELDDGTVWIGDTHLHAIRAFTADGKYVGQIGREGEGPGEFRYASSMRVLPDGSVAVWDDGLIRVSRFAPDGAFLDSFTPRTIMMTVPAEEFEVDREGNLYLIARRFADVSDIDLVDGRFPLQAARAALGVGTPWFWFELRPSGEVLDSVYLEPFAQETHADGLFTYTVISPLGYRVVARNEVSARDDTYMVELRSDGGAFLRIERPFEPVAYRRAERAEKQRLAEVFAARTGRPAGRVPDHKPPFKGIYVDADGRIWVERYAPGRFEPESPAQRAEREAACRFFGVARSECEEGIREWHEDPVYDVIEPSGRYLGRLELPRRNAEVVLARGDAAWVVEKGKLDEPYVVRYAIEPGS